MRLGVLLQEEVRVVRRDDLDAELRAEREDLRVHAGLVLEEAAALVVEEDALRAVEHHLEVVVLAEDALVPARRALGLGVVAVAERGRHLAGDAGRRDDQLLVVFLQELVVDAGLVVHALDAGERGEADEVVVAGAVLREEDEVAAGVVLAVVAVLVLVVARAPRDVGLAAEDGLQGGERGPLLVLLEAAGVVERLEAEEVAVVGDGDRGHPERPRAGGERADLARAVEQRIGRVDV